MDAIPYVVLNQEGEWINVILWDGISEWQPPEGCIVVPLQQDLSTATD